MACALRALRAWVSSEPNAGANRDGQDGICSLSTRKLLFVSLGVLRVGSDRKSGEMKTLWCLRCATEYLPLIPPRPNFCLRISLSSLNSTGAKLHHPGQKPYWLCQEAL